VIEALICLDGAYALSTIEDFSLVNVDFRLLWELGSVTLADGDKLAVRRKMHI
jgi:hypothetical protein